MTEPPATLLPTIPEREQHAHRAPNPAWWVPVLAGALYLLFWLAVPRLPGSLGSVLVSTVISIGLLVWIPAEFARTFRQSRTLAWMLVAATVVNVPMRLMFALGHRIPPWSYLAAVPGLPDLLFIWLAACVGSLLSGILRTANMIPPVAAVLAIVDVWTVLLGGPVQKIMQSQTAAAQAVRHAMTVPVPAARGAVGAEPIALAVGFADFLFIAFFIAAICRFGFPEAAFRRTVLTLIAALSVYMLAVFFFRWNLPALLPMAVVMLALHWRRFHYERSELFALLYAALFIAAIVAGFWYFGRQSQAPVEAGPAAMAAILAQ